MPIRKTPLITEEIYHIFNRGVDLRPIFLDKRDYRRAINLLDFYQVGNSSLRYSKFNKLPKNLKRDFVADLKSKPKVVEVISFCLMPNHYHLLVKQKGEGGIGKFVRNFQIGFSKYFNEKRGRCGPLFQGQFKVVRVETDKQLLHLSRYIHLNPYSSFLVKNLDDLENYSWSSYPEYISNKEGICRKDLIFSLIKNREAYRKFVLDNADYQRELGRIKHLVLE